MQTRFILALALPLTAFACASKIDGFDADSMSQAKTVTPKGAPFGLQVDLPGDKKLEQISGELSIRFLPTGKSRADSSNWLELSPGKASFMSASDGCLAVITSAGTTEDCNYRLKAKSVEVVRLSSLAPMFDGIVLGHPEILLEGTGAGRSGTMHLESVGESIVLPGKYSVKLADKAYAVLVPQGAAQFSAKLTPDDVMTVTVAPPSDTAQFPNHHEASAVLSIAANYTSANLTSGIGRVYALKDPLISKAKDDA